MDIYCTKCGEPWDVIGITDEAEEFGLTPAEMHAKFRREGCEAMGTSHSGIGEVNRVVNGVDVISAMSALNDMLGDDVDGAAAMMEDWGF
jgi:hypothetical protein